MLVTVLLLVFVAIAAATDLVWHKIYNWTTYSGMLVALLLNVGGDLLLYGGSAGDDQLQRLGYIGSGQCLVGLLLCGFMVLFCFVIFTNMGGGDVKLIAMMGAFLGPYDGIVAMLWTFIIGACLGVIVLIWRVGAWRLACRVFRQLVYSLRIFGWNPLDEEERKQLQAPLHLAPSALAAVVVVEFSLINLM